MTRTQILTVTLNPAIDRMVEISHFRLGDDNRIDQGVSFPGGKGINVSRALKNLGIASITTGFAGGANGQNLLRDLLLEGLEHNYVFIQGETRVNVTIVDPRSSKNGKVTRVLDTGPVIDAKDLSSFRDKFRRLAQVSQWIILSGSRVGGTPKTFYRELVKTARQNGGKVILDTSDDLRGALCSRPFLVKINHKEAENVLGKKLRTAENFRAALKKFLDLGAENVIISLGKNGAVATDGKVFYEIVCPKVKASHTVGCGDAMTAGFIYGFRKSEDFLLGLVAAVAAGTACCSSMVTLSRPGRIDPQIMKKFLKQIIVRVL